MCVRALCVCPCVCVCVYVCMWHCSAYDAFVYRRARLHVRKRLFTCVVRVREYLFTCRVRAGARARACVASSLAPAPPRPRGAPMHREVVRKLEKRTFMTHLLQPRTQILRVRFYTCLHCITWLQLTALSVIHVALSLSLARSLSLSLTLSRNSDQRGAALRMARFPKHSVFYLPATEQRPGDEQSESVYPKKNNLQRRRRVIVKVGIPTPY